MASKSDPKRDIFEFQAEMNSPFIQKVQKIPSDFRTFRFQDFLHNSGFKLICDRQNKKFKNVSKQSYSLESRVKTLKTYSFSITRRFTGSTTKFTSSLQKSIAPTQKLHHAIKLHAVLMEGCGSVLKSILLSMPIFSTTYLLA